MWPKGNEPTVIVARPAITDFPDLGGIAIKGALEQCGACTEQVDYPIMGQGLQAGAGHNRREPRYAQAP